MRIDTHAKAIEWLQRRGLQLQYKRTQDALRQVWLVMSGERCPNEIIAIHEGTYDHLAACVYLSAESDAISCIAYADTDAQAILPVIDRTRDVWTAHNKAHAFSNGRCHREHVAR